MTIATPRKVRVRLGHDCDGPSISALEIWSLDPPAPFGEAGSTGTAVFDFFTSVDLEPSDHMWMSVDVDSREISASRFRVVRAWSHEFGASSWILEGDVLDLWRQFYLLRMVSDATSFSATFLRNEVQRLAWIRAAVAYSPLITPWLWTGFLQDDSGFESLQIGRFRLAIEPAMFRSRSIFFSQVGERLFGPAGYAGQDLDGFAEMMRRVSDVADGCDVSILSPDVCEQVAAESGIGPDFYRTVEDILSESCGFEVLPVGYS